MSEEYIFLDEEKTRKIIQHLTSLGWEQDRKNATSHRIFKHPKSKETITLSYHGSGAEIPKGIAKKIMKQSTMLHELFSELDEDGAMGAGAVGTTSSIPANNTDSSGEAEIAANPPVKRKKTNLLRRNLPMNRPPKSLRDIVGKEMKNDRRADKR